MDYFISREMHRMKLFLLTAFFLILPGIGNAQEGAAGDADRHALLPETRTAVVESLHTEINRIAAVDGDIIAAWRIRMDRVAAGYSRPSRQELMDEGRLASSSQREDAANEARNVSHAMLKETLKMAQEQFPRLDTLIKALRLEVTTDMLPEPEVAADMEPDGRHAVLVHQEKTRKLFMRTGLRAPVEGGRLSLLSETEAIYGNMTSYVKVQLAGHVTSWVGFAYNLNNELRVRVERQSSSNSGGVITSMTSGGSLHLIQVVCAF
jgi:hypothetical protein